MEELSKTKREIRRQHNDDVLKRMRNGESLSRMDSRSTWFPPRPSIAKDPDAMKRLYGNLMRDGRRPQAGKGEVVRLKDE
jgi:hypothetical protein